ncbi:MAG: O-antigen ligase domain-containing protein [Magnetospirillum sp.]|nr:MAG: O-antigen ligase domain-containing protein [Magnetospirillum sp.]
MTNPPSLPPGAIATAAVVAVAGLAVAVLAPAALATRPAYAAIPLLFVVALWLIPLGLALARGERWAYVLAMAALIFLTDATFRSRSWADKSFDWQVMLKGLVWFGCGLGGTLRLGRTLPRLTTPPMLFVLLFVVALGLSTAWSPSPSYTFLSAMGFLCFLLFAAAAAEVLDERHMLLGLAIGGGLIVLPSLAVSPFAMGLTPLSPGSTGEVGRLRGITDHPIPLAESSAIFIFACLALLGHVRRFGGRALLVILAAAGIATALLTQSRLPVLAMAAAAAVYWSFRRGGALLVMPVLAGFITVILATESVAGFARLLPSDILESLSRSGHSKEILTLSGRLLIWPYVMEQIADAPWLGHGHAAGIALFRGFTPWRITHAHNAYLQALLSVGIVGSLPFLAALVTQLRIFVTRPSPVRDILLLNGLILGMTETSMIANMPSQGVLLWMLAAAMAVKTGK